MLELTEEGKKALLEHRKIYLTEAPVPIEKRAVSSARSGRSDALDNVRYDAILFERLRVVRKKLADDRGIPAYLIFSDVTLRQMSRDYPCDTRAFLRISGVGEKKLEEFGQTFLKEISEYLHAHPLS